MADKTAEALSQALPELVKAAKEAARALEAIHDELVAIKGRVENIASGAVPVRRR